MNTLTERTARGYHMFFVTKNLASGEGEGCEFKASGVCMVTPSIHPSGKLYQIVNDTSIALLDENRVHELFPFLSKARSKKDYQSNATSSVVNTLRCPKSDSAGGGVIARIKAARPTIEEVCAAGLDLRPGGRSVLVGLCPFHDDHHPSLWVNPESGLWGCNKPSCPAGGIHDVINFRALIQGISNGEAIRQMADQFL